MMRKCEFCAYFDPGDPENVRLLCNDGVVLGQCRRRSPVLVRIAGGTFDAGRWPHVRPDGWCGEYANGPKAPKPPPIPLSTGRAG